MNCVVGNTQVVRAYPYLEGQGDLVPPDPSSRHTCAKFGSSFAADGCQQRCCEVFLLIASDLDGFRV